MPDVDLIVLGAGSAGIGVASAAVAKKLSVMVIERAQPMQATSNNTLRVIHGGFRYLQTLNFSRVIESLQSQSRLVSEFPDLIEPLACLMPLSAYGMKSRWPVEIAALMFSKIQRAYSSKVPSPAVLSKSEVINRFGLETKFGALLWFDATILKPSVLHSRLVERLNRAGVRFLQHTPVKKVEAFPNYYKVGDLSARYVVNALGPWIEEIEAPFVKRDGVSWCTGFNIEFDLNSSLYALAGATPGGRLLFSVPRDGRLAVGTWYLAGRIDTLSEDQIERALTDISQAFPHLSLSRKQIMRFDIGIIPSKFGRESFFRSGGYLEILSTKYTTFYSQGERALKKIADCA